MVLDSTNPEITEIIAFNRVSSMTGEYFDGLSPARRGVHCISVPDPAEIALSSCDLSQS
jgi:hypothetical protein